MNRKEREKFAKIGAAADLVGVVFCIIANLAVVLGELTPVFERLHAVHGGVKFTYNYLCPIVYPIMEPLIINHDGTKFGIFLVAEGVIVMSALAYRWISYFGMRIVSALLV
jgi:hypothetical protein